MSELKTGVGLTEANLRKLLQKFNEDLGMYINSDERFRLGQVLTIIDASIADPEQRKAIKDLIQNTWWTPTNKPSDSEMLSPHSDLRAICEVFGFELYPADETNTLQAYNADDLTWVKKRYSDALVTRK